MTQEAGDPQLRDQNIEQWELSQTDFNRWVAGVQLGRNPSPLEAFIHFAKNGAERYRQEHSQACNSV
jgi:hypothetical protein